MRALSMVAVFVAVAVIGCGPVEEHALSRELAPGQVVATESGKSGNFVSDGQTTSSSGRVGAMSLDQAGAADTCSGSCDANTCSCYGTYECCQAGCNWCWGTFFPVAN